MVYCLTLKIKKFLFSEKLKTKQVFKENPKKRYWKELRIYKLKYLEATSDEVYKLIKTKSLLTNKERDILFALVKYENVPSYLLEITSNSEKYYVTKRKINLANQISVYILPNGATIDFKKVLKYYNIENSDIKIKILSQIEKQEIYDNFLKIKRIMNPNKEIVNLYENFICTQFHKRFAFMYTELKNLEYKDMIQR